MSRDKYTVLTLHREWDNKAIVRLNGFSNLVFWREIPLVQRWWHRKSPRQKIFEAQQAAAKKAEQLRWRDDVSTFEFNGSVREG